MLRITLENVHDELYSKEVTRENAINLKKSDMLTENEKISIMSDSMFKSLFCNSKNLKYGAKFISFFFDEEYEKILKNIRLTRNELDKDNLTVKAERCDYVAELKGILVNIEVNCNTDKETMLRNLEYAFRLFSSKVKVGSEYNYSPIIQFNWNNFSFKGNEEIIEVYGIQKDNCLRLTNNIIIVQIYIPNIIKKCYTKGVESLDEFERFILALATMDKNLSKKMVKGDKYMDELLEKQEELTLSADLRQSYDHELAMKKWGIEEGIEQTKKEAAIEFHKNGVSDDLIIKSLHITREKLEEYLNEEQLQEDK